MKDRIGHLLRVDHRVGKLRFQLHVVAGVLRERCIDGRWLDERDADRSLVDVLDLAPQRIGEAFDGMFRR